jgi:hypothetical protein
MRHLIHSFAVGALRRGKTIEQFLGEIQTEHGRGIRWLEISPTRDGFIVYRGDVVDVGTDDRLDISVFPWLDPEHEDDDDRMAVAATPEEALAFAERFLAAHPDRWVNQGVVCDEYADYRRARTPQPPAGP